jgi:hypothetical protein
MKCPKMKAEPAMQDFLEIERLHRETLNPSGAFIPNPSGKSIP